MKLHITHLMDFRRIMPVLKRAERQEIENSCISSSYLFYEFQILKLTINMRLQKLEQNFNTLTQEEKNDFKLQKAYGEMILAIGEGQYHENADILNEIQFRSILILKNSKLLISFIQMDLILILQKIAVF